MARIYRPGVYSRYQVIAFGRERLDKAGIFCGKVQQRTNHGEEQAYPLKITEKTQLEQLFAREENPGLWGVASLWLGRGLDLWVVPVQVEEGRTEAEGYEAAFQAALGIGGAGAILCDSSDLQVLASMKNAAEQALKQQKEWLAFGFCPKETAVQAAASLNSERIVLCCQQGAGQGEENRGLFTAAAMAAKVLGLSAPNENLNGAAVDGLTQVEQLSETQIETMLEAGVTVLEEVGQEVQCIRGVTTRTKTGQDEDRSLSAITTVLMIDHVMQAVRSRLDQLMKGLRTDRYTLEAIKTQAAVVLGEEKTLGIVTSFAPPQAHRDRADPSVCHVQLQFALAAVISQIWITAEITL